MYDACPEYPQDLGVMIKNWKVLVCEKKNKRIPRSDAAVNNSFSNYYDFIFQAMTRKAPNSMFNWGHLLGTILHLVQMSLAYLLMLVVMTFNTWLCLAVVLGSTLGYFLVGWKRPAGAIDVSDHCH